MTPTLLTVCASVSVYLQNARNVSVADRFGRFIEKWSRHNLELRDSLAAHEEAAGAHRAQLAAERIAKTELLAQLSSVRAHALRCETEAAAAINHHIRRTKFLNAQLARLSSLGLDGDVGGIDAARARRLEAGRVLVDQVLQLQSEIERMRGARARSRAVVSHTRLPRSQMKENEAIRFDFTASSR